MNDSEQEGILGLDNIRLELPIAGVGSRTLAGSIDYFVLGVLVVIWLFVWGLLLARLGTWMVALLVLGMFLLEWGYFAASEIATGGRTLGKMAVKLRVVTAEGGSPSAGALLSRNLVRSLDLVFGVPLMAIDPLSRRLGDRLAGTLVVHDRKVAAAPLIGRVPPGWGSRELAAVEAFLSQAQDLESSGRLSEMADHILDRLRRDAPELLAGLDTRRHPVEVIRKALQVEDA